MKTKHIYVRVAMGVMAVAATACFPAPAGTQQGNSVLEQRVSALEKYVEALDATILELSTTLNQSIQEYTQGLEASLEDYSRKLQINIEERMNARDKKVVVLNPYARSYQAIESNSGIFLIAIEQVEAIDNGFRLRLNIGNPNYADFQNFQLKFFWGPGWGGSPVMPYTDWHSHLNGAEFTFQGKIEKGMWNAMTVDLISAEKNDLGYLECELSVSGVELGYK